MKLLVAFCFSLICAAVFAGDVPESLLKPVGKTFKHTALLQKYAKKNRGFITFSLHKVDRWEPLPEGIANYEPEFTEDDQVIGLECLDKTKGRNADPVQNGALVTEIPKAGEIVVQVDTRISTYSEPSAAAKAKYRKEMRAAADMNDKITSLVGDVSNGSGLTLTQDSALRRQAAGASDALNVDDKTEKREYTLRGFDDSRIKVGDRISFSGIFTVRIEDGKKVIEPYRE